MYVKKLSGKNLVAPDLRAGAALVIAALSAEGFSTIDNIEYDGSKTSTAYNIYGALTEGRAVCEGYARAFKYILDDMDIPTIIVCGIGQNRENETESHAWNYVYIDRQWYAIDTTWDDPVIRGTGIINESFKYSYFLKGSNSFFTDHIEDGNIVGDANFVYPKISETDY